MCLVSLAVTLRAAKLILYLVNNVNTGRHIYHITLLPYSNVKVNKDKWF